MPTKILHLDGAREALAALGEGFFPDLDWIEACSEVSAEEVPPPARDMLVHEGHMTAALKARYGQPLALRVLDYRENGDQYRRKIALTVDGGRKVVEFGIVRLDFRFTPSAARRAILERNVPLGDIFAQHKVLTRVEPLWYLQFAPGSALAEYFRPPPTGSLYGRIGVIHCNNRPALELLEVVRPEEAG